MNKNIIILLTALCTVQYCAFAMERTIEKRKADEPPTTIPEIASDEATAIALAPSPKRRANPEPIAQQPLNRATQSIKPTTEDARNTKLNGFLLSMETVKNAQDAQNLVEEWLKDGNEINAKFRNAWTALMLAAQNGHLLVVQCLLENGAKALINAKNSNGTTALAVAARNGHLQIVECLLENGSNIEEKTNNGNCALALATRSGKRSVVAFLTQKYKELGIPLPAPAKKSDAPKEVSTQPLTVQAPVAPQMLKAPAARIYTQQAEGVINSNAITADTALALLEQLLAFAAAEALKGNGNFLAKILSDTQKKNQQVQQDSFAKLEKALKENNQELVPNLLVLIEKTPTPLFTAIERGHIETAKKLIEQGTYNDAKNDKGETPFMLARQKAKENSAYLELLAALYEAKTNTK